MGSKKVLFARKILTIYVNLHPSLCTLCNFYVQIMLRVEVLARELSQGTAQLNKWLPPSACSSGALVHRLEQRLAQRLIQTGTSF